MNSSDICTRSQSVSGEIDSTEKNLVGLFPLLYAIPSIVLDIFIVNFLLSKEGRVEFGNIFSTLFAIFGIIEMSDWVLYNLIQRLSSAPLMGFLYVWIPKDGIIVSIFYFVVSYVGYLGHITSLLLTINRLTSVIFPISHERNWRKVLKPILTIYFLYPLIFSWQFLIMNQVRHCQIWDITSTISYHMFIAQPPYYGIPLTLGVTSVSFLVSISCLVMNITTMVLLISRRKHRHTNTSTERKARRTEIKMFILTLLMFFNEFTIAVMFLISYFVSPTSSVRATILVIQPFIKDLICLTPPWMLIIMSKKVRSKLFRRVFKHVHSTAVQLINHS